MKRNLLLTIIFVFCMIYAYPQSQLIIEEDFQEWEATEDTDPSTCSAGVVLEDSITRNLTLTISSGTVQIPVTLIKCGIAPECESRRIEDGGASENLPGVTTGWVLLNKLTDGDTTVVIPITMNNMEESPDTLGEFIFGPIPQIDSIRFAHSATGSKRGIRIYTSYDAENWERPTTDEFWDGDDCQLGDVNTVEINDTNVYIKFTSGFKQSDGTSQYSRLHNIHVYGIPGEVTNVSTIKHNRVLKVYPNPANDIVNIKSPIPLTSGKLEIYNMLGAKVLENNITKQLTGLDISSLKQGVYFIQLNVNNKRFTQSLIVK